jgi:hypothetical protein
MIRRLRAHPRGEALIEPQVVPPRHRHQVAEPLVRDFVRDDAIDAFLRVRGTGRRIVEKRGVVIRDAAPSFSMPPAPVLARLTWLSCGRGYFTPK